MSERNIVYLSLGTNLGDREKNLEKAVAALGVLGNVLKVSSIHETKAWGKIDQPDFLNLAVKMETLFPPLQFLEKTQEIEAALGRVRTEKWGPRSIDIDLLLWNDETVDHPLLRIPHPLMWEREFVLAPLREIRTENPR